MLLRRVCNLRIEGLSSCDIGDIAAVHDTGQSLASAPAGSSEAEVVQWRRQAALLVRHEELSCWRALDAWMQQNLPL